jgi:pyocin large subunit-like protein
MADDNDAKTRALRDELSKPDPSLPNVAGNEDGDSSKRAGITHEPDDEPDQFEAYNKTRPVAKKVTLPNGIIYKKLGAIDLKKIPRSQLVADAERWEAEENKATHGEYAKAAQFVADKFGDRFDSVVQSLVAKSIDAGLSPATALYHFAIGEGFKTSRAIIDEIRNGQFTGGDFD